MHDFVNADVNLFYAVDDSIIFANYIYTDTNWVNHISFLRTLNGGLTWEQIDTTSNIYSFIFKGDVGLYYSDSAIYRTTDKGEHWQLTSFPPNWSSYTFILLDSLNFLTYLPNGYSTNVFITNDGGVTHDSITFNKYIEHIVLTGDNTGYFSSGYNLYKFDHHNYYPLFSDDSLYLNKICFLSPIEAVAAGNNGIIYRTYNMGQTWIPTYTGVNSNFTTMSFPSQSVGYVYGSNNNFLKTTDGGISWHIMPKIVPDSTYEIIKLFFINEQVGYTYAMFSQFVLKTLDGGNTWFQYLNSPKEISDLYFVDENTGYVSTLGDFFSGGFLAKTTDGGSTWSTTPSTGSLTKIVYIDSLRMFVVECGWGFGDFSRVYYTENGGNTWEFNSLNANVYDIMMIDSLNGILAATNMDTPGPSLYYTSDGGHTWDSLYFRYQPWVSYYNSALYKTINNDIWLYYSNFRAKGRLDSVPANDFSILHAQYSSFSSNCFSPYGISMNFVGDASQYNQGDTVNITINWGDGSDTTYIDTVGSNGNFYKELNHVYYSPGQFIPEIIASTASEADTFHVTPVIVYASCGDISGTVKYNENSTCISDSLSQPLPNIKVLLTDNTGNIIDMQFTDNNGGFGFDVPSTSNYFVKIDSVYLGQLYVACQNSLPVDTVNTTNHNFILYCNPAGYICANMLGDAMRPFGEMTFFVNFIKYSCDTSDYSFTITTDPSVYILNTTELYSEVPRQASFGPYAIGNHGGLSFPVSYTTDSLFALGDSICFTLTVYEGTTVVFTNEYCFPVVNSYDPNYKEVSPEEYLTPSDTVFYTIHFQNTGNDVAYNITIRDTVDDNFNPESLNVLAASHDYSVRVISYSPLVVEFFFPEIMLTDSGQSQILSCGFIKYYVTQKPGLHFSTCFTNTALIYFDYNSPVITNTTVNCYYVPVGIAGAEGLSDILPYPNPSDDILTVRLSEGSNLIRIYNQLGRCVYDGSVECKTVNKDERLHVGNLRIGLYYIQVSNSETDQVSTFKFIVE